MTACLSDEQLRALVDAPLDTTDDTSIAAHVQACARCRARRDDLARTGEQSACSVTVDVGPAIASAGESTALIASEAKSPVHEATTVLPPEDATVDYAGDGEGFAPDAPGDPRPRVFGDYEILRELARGGMGVVFQARQVSLNRRVALKMILAGQLADEAAVRRFYLEAEAAAHLEHPGIVPIYEVGQHAGQHYFSMAFVEGQSLSGLLAGGPLPPRRAAELMVEVAAAIEYAHRRGVIHRDLKPGNILLDQAGHPRVTDFGLAKKLKGDSELTGSGQIIGTPSYMPPEQAGRDRGDVGPSADIYSLGATLYALLTGRPPFQAATPIETVLQVIREDPVPPRGLNPSIPRDLETICLKCLHKEPQKRYGSAQELADDLVRYREGSPIRARVTPLWERGLKWSRRRPVAALVLALGLAAIIGLTVGGFLYQRSSRLRDERWNAWVLEEQNRAMEQLDQADRAGTAAELQKAQVDLATVRQEVRSEPRLQPISHRIEAKQKSVADRLRDLRLSEAAQQRDRDDRERFQRFRELRQEAQLYAAGFGVLVASDRSENLRASAHAALAIYAHDPRASDDAWSLAKPLPSALTESEKARVADDCYDLLLMRSQAADPVDGLRILDRAARLRPKTTAAYHRRRAECLERQGDLAGRDREIRAADKIPPVTALDFFLNGRELVERRRFADAVRPLNSALQADPDQTSAHLLLAACDLNMKALSQARTSLTTCINSHRGLVGLYLLRALVSGEEGNQALEKLAQGHPDEAEAIRPGVDGLLQAQAQADTDSLELRLALFDARGDQIVQSDGQSSTNPDPLIDEHLDAGTDYLVVQSLSGSGSYSISTSLTPSSGLDQALPIPTQFTNVYSQSGNGPPIAVGDFTNDGIPDLLTPQGLYLGTGDGTFEPPSADQVLIQPSEQVATAIAVGNFVEGNPDLDAAFTVEGVNASGFPTGPEGILIFLGNGNGTFQAPTFIPPPHDSHPVAIVAGDFGNGHVDLAIADSGNEITGGKVPGGVTVLWGDGDGTFQPPTFIALPTGSVAQAITAGAFEDDNNGLLDLAVAGVDSDGSGEFTILSNIGGGTFLPLAPVALPVSGAPTAIVAGDFGTGHLDLAVSDGLNARVDIFRGNGDGTFELASTAAVGQGGGDLVAGDFGNGQTDLAVGATFGVDDVLVLLGDGDGTFQAPISIATGAYPTSIVAGQFDGDSRLDLAFSSGNYGTAGTGMVITVLRGNGDGTFQDPAPNPVGELPGAVATGDFNGDGNLDLAVVNESSDNVSILLGNGDGTFQAATTLALPAGDSPGAIVTGDFNGDGRTDLAITNAPFEGPGSALVFLGDGDGTFQSLPPIPVPAGSYLMTEGDFTGNGRTDLAVASASGIVTILLNNGDGTFRSLAPIQLSIPNDAQLIGAIVAGDFNGDGRLDLAVASTPAPSLVGGVYVYGGGPDELTLLMGNGDGTFLPQPPISLEGSAASSLSLVAGDFRNDGRTDLAVAINTVESSTDNSGNEDSIEVLLGNGDGTFQAPSVIDLDNDNRVGPVAIAAGDFEGNGRLDLATVDMFYSLSTGISTGVGYTVSLGNGDGTFQAPMETPLAGSGFPTGLVAADFAGNGRADLAMIQYDPDDVSVLLSNGNGTFSDPAATDLARQDTPLVADMNGDGTPDVAEVDSSGDILYRQGIPGQPDSFLAPVTINPGFPSRDIAWVPGSPVGPLLASVDSQDDAVSLYAWRNGGLVRIGSLATGALPAQIIAADLDDDGVTDLVVRNAGDDTLSIYYGTSPDPAGPVNPKFQAQPQPFLSPVTISVEPGISDVEAIDTTGSGRLDLVVTDQLSGHVSVRVNEGGGIFAPPVSYRAGTELSQIETTSEPHVSSPEATAGVAAGPLTPGGPTTLVTINPGSNALDVLVGLGGGRFANPVQIDTPSPALAVRVADFTGDGVADLAVLTAEGVSIYLGDGSGGFLPPVTYKAGTDPTGLTVADLLGNGQLDLLVGNSYGDVLILVGNGDGTFQPFEPVKGAIALAVADLTGNGVPDFVFADQSLNRVSVVYGSTTSNATGPQVIGSEATGVLSPGAVLLADLNGDGIPDLIVANSGGNNVLVYPGLGNGQFGPPVNGTAGFPVGTDPTGLTLANLNGQPDLLVADTGSNDVSILLGQGSGSSWTMTAGPRIQTDAGPVATVVGDVLPGKQLSLAVANSQADTVQLFPSVGDGFFDDQAAATTSYSVGQDPSGLFLGDFNGVPGLATLNAGSNNGTLITGLGSASPLLQTFPTGGDRPTTAFTGDFIGNGFTDLVVGNNGDGSLALLLGGSGGLSLSQTLTSAEAPSPTGLSFGGVNDGLLDFYVSTAGHEAAMNLAFNLTGGPEGEGGVIAVPVGSTPSESSAAGVLSQATSGSVQQVAQLLSLSGTTLDLAATLLTVSVVEIESGSSTAAAGGTTGPGQGLGPGRSSTSNPDDEPAEEAGQGDEESEATAERAPAWERLAIGLDRSWERARAAILKLDDQATEAMPRKPPTPPAVGRQPIPAPTRPTTESRPESPSASAPAGPMAPEAASSIRRPEDPGRAVDAALVDLAADREADGPMGRWLTGFRKDPTRPEEADLTQVMVAAVASAAWAGTRWALDRRRPALRPTVPIGLR